MAVKMSDVIKRYDNRGQTLNFYFEKVSSLAMTVTVRVRMFTFGLLFSSQIEPYHFLLFFTAT